MRHLNSPLVWLRRVGLAGLTGGTLLTLSILVSGCNEADSSATGLTGPEATASETAIPSLTLTELPSTLALTAEQSQLLEAAIGELNQSRRALHEGSRRGAQDGGRVRDRIRRALGDEAEPPMLVFLEASSQILQTDQFRILCEYLVANRPDRGQQGEMGGRGRDRMQGRLAQELGLTDDQSSQVHELMRSSADQLRTLLDAVRSGTVTPAEGVTRATQLAQSSKSELAAILTPEQLVRFEELKQGRIDQAIDHRLEKLEDHLTRRAGFLGKVLDLSDAQSNQVEQILLGSVPEREAMLSGVQAGTLPPQVAVMMGIQLELALMEEIKGLLTEEQQARLDALKDLIPLGGHRLGLGGFGGDRGHGGPGRI